MPTLIVTGRRVLSPAAERGSWRSGGSAVHRLLVTSGQNHAADTRIGRQTREFAAKRRELVVVVNGAKGLSILNFPNPAKAGVVSVRRNDTGNAAVGYVIY